MQDCQISARAGGVWSWTPCLLPRVDFLAIDETKLHGSLFHNLEMRMVLCSKKVKKDDCLKLCQAAMLLFFLKDCYQFYVASKSSMKLEL